MQAKFYYIGEIRGTQEEYLGIDSDASWRDWVVAIIAMGENPAGRGISEFTTEVTFFLNKRLSTKSFW